MPKLNVKAVSTEFVLIAGDKQTDGARKTILWRNFYENAEVGKEATEQERLCKFVKDSIFVLTNQEGNTSNKHSITKCAKLTKRV